MKVETTISLSEELLEAIDNQPELYSTRSDFIGAAVRAFLAQKADDERDARDLEIINRRANYFNAEAADVLAYQGDL